MTLDEAIEILTDILLYVEPGDPPEEHDALKLGIKALKVVKLGLAGKVADITLFQKGETEG